MGSKIEVDRNVAVIGSPAWMIEPETTVENSLLRSRDLRFGWLHYFFPKKTTEQLVSRVAAEAGESPASGHESDKPAQSGIENPPKGELSVPRAS